MMNCFPFTTGTSCNHVWPKAPWWVLYSLIVVFGCTLRPARGRSYNNCNIILLDWNKPAIFALIGQAKLSGCLPEEEEEEKEEEYVVYSTMQQDVNIEKSWAC